MLANAKRFIEPQLESHFDEVFADCGSIEYSALANKLLAADRYAGYCNRLPDGTGKGCVSPSGLAVRFARWYRFDQS